MGFKMKGYPYPGTSPLKQKGEDENKDSHDDQSKEAAVKKGNACAICGTLKGNHKADHRFTTAKELNEQDDKKLDAKEDAAGVTTNVKPRKVHKDGPKNRVHGVKNPGNWQPHQFKK